jgi:tyrosine-protein kinase Etk/Wzc
MLPQLRLRDERSGIELRANPAASARNPTLNDFRAMLRRHPLLLALCLGGAVLLGVGYNFFATRIYEATSVLRFEMEQVNLPQLVTLLSTENRIGTEIEVLQGRNAAAAVIDSLGLRARLTSPRHARVSEQFALLKVRPDADTLTLNLRREWGGRSFVINMEKRSPVDISARIGDTVEVGGVTLVLAPPSLEHPELRVEVVSQEEAVRNFSSNLRVSRPALGTDLISVRVRSSDPEQAAATANLLGQQLISGRQNVQLARTGSTVRFLRQQLDTLGKELRRAEDNLRVFRERAGVVDAEEDARTQVRRLAQVQADRGAIEAERQALAQLLQQIQSDSARAAPGGPAPSRSLVSFPTLFRNPAASELLGALAQVENQRSQLLVRRTQEDPDVIVLNDRVRDLDTQLRKIAETYLQGLTNQVTSLQEVARGFGGALDSLPRKEVQAARLQRQVRVQQDLYTLIQTRLKEAEITQAMEDPTVRIVDPAVIPDKPVRPNVPLNLAISLVLGSLLGFVTTVRQELTNRSVRTRGDAVITAGLPVLAAIPRLEARTRRLLPDGRRRSHHHHHRGLNRLARRMLRAVGLQSNGHRHGAGARLGSLLVTRTDTPPVFAESWNQLHANLFLTHQERLPKVLLFTSPLPGEGKTLSSINFALTLAARELRVLLIDADFRCGLVNEVFGYPRFPGFAEVLAGSAHFEDAAQRIPVGETGSLVILPAGAPLTARGKGLSVESVRQLLGTLTPKFDLILIDSPPVNLLADAALLGSTADAVVVVVRAGRTKIEALRYAVDQLTVARAPVIGTLLNDIDLRRHADDDDSYGYMTEVGRYYAARS